MDLIKIFFWLPNMAPRFVTRGMRWFYRWLLVVWIAIYAIQPDAIELTEHAKTSSRSGFEELVVTGSPIDGSMLNLLEMQRAYERKHLASRYFKLGRYEEAYPRLLELAKMGMKDSQARLAFLYLHGLGGVPKSNIKALAWLGTAVVDKTRPQYRTLFKHLMSEVPPAHQPAVNRAIAEYRGKYESKVRGVECALSGMNRLLFTCRFKDEMWQRLQMNPNLYGQIIGS